VWKPVWKDINILKLKEIFFNKLGSLLKLSFLLKYFVFHKTAKYSNQNKLFSVHFQEMPGFKGKRKRGLTLTLYKKTFRYRLPVSPPRKRTKTSSSTPNLKSPSIRTPSLLKKISFNFKIFISWWRISHLTWFIFVKPLYNVQKQLKCNIIQREFSILY
jgi:hypothetical protein